VLRVMSRGPLWLDEAQSVAFARLPLTSIPSALREDGAPPLYYLVLHGWVRLFGDGDAAVRSLSIAASLAFVGVITAHAARRAGATAAATTAVVAATTPYAVRYGSEARMYALVALEVAVGIWAMDAALTKQTPWRLGALAAITAALLYTHYWALYLVASVVVVLARGVYARRRAGRSTRDLVGAASAIAVGGLLWLPWLPTFLFQAENTGTPWSRPTIASMVRITSGASDGGLLPALFVVIGVILAVLVRRVRTTGSLAPGAVAAVLILCPLIAAIGALSSGSAYVSRYASVVFPLAVFLTGLAATRLPRVSITVACLALFALGCGALSLGEAHTDRTRAAMLADALEGRVRDGDLLVYCPDQLGPAMSRVLDQRGIDVDQRVFPDGDPERVEWIGYEERYATSRPASFAEQLALDAGSNAIWLVWSETYPPTQPRCAGLRRALGRLRDVTLDIPDDGSLSDHAGLRRYSARITQ
jgi:hypothetical protein